MIYILTLDNTQPSISFMLVHNFITKSFVGIDDWWHYLPTTYLLHTETVSMHNISNNIHTLYPELKFFISKLDHSEFNGFLPKEAWEWLNKYKSKTLRSQTTQKFNPISNKITPKQLEATIKKILSEQKT